MKFMKTINEAYREVLEKLDPKKDDMGDYVKDFQKSDAPQFKGKSKEKIQKMAVAAYLDAKDEVKEGAKNSVISMTKFKNPKIVKQVSDIIKKVGTDKIKVKNVPGGMEISGSNVHLTQVIDSLFNATIKKGSLETPALIQMKEETLDELKEPFIVVDTAQGNKVVGMASDEKEAQSIISSSELPPMKIKNKKTLKVVKVRKKQMIGRPLQEDGHMDVPSSIRMCKTIMEDAQQIEQVLRTMGDEEIDTWWTNKLAVASSSLNKLRDYIVNPVQEARKSKFNMDDDDEESANKHIVMQLRKNVDLKGQKVIEFEDGKKQKVPLAIAKKAVLQHAGLRKPDEKDAFQKKIAKSYKDLLSAIKGK